jgi:hypothetical protein
MTRAFLASGHERSTPLPTMKRREFLIWLVCILLANQIFSFPAASSGTLLETLATALISKSVFYYLGWFAVFNLLLATDREQPISGIDVAVALSATLLNFLPGPSAPSWFSVSAVALLLVVRSDGDSKLKAAAAVLLALALNGYWGPRFFDIFAYYLLRADAALVGAALSLTQPGMSWHETIIGRPGEHSVLIFNPCSSFHNISLGLLCWVSLTKLVRTSWVRGDLAVALAVCAAVIVWNATRLYLMALSNDHYTYWHQGTGEQLVAWGTTMTVLLISLWGAVHIGRRR